MTAAGDRMQGVMIARSPARIAKRRHTITTPTDTPTAKRQAYLETLETIANQVDELELTIARMANDPAMDIADAPELLDGQWLLIASAQDDEPVSIRPFGACPKRLLN